MKIKKSYDGEKSFYFFSYRESMVVEIDTKVKANSRQSCFSEE